MATTHSKGTTLTQPSDFKKGQQVILRGTVETVGENYITIERPSGNYSALWGGFSDLEVQSQPLNVGDEVLADSLEPPVGSVVAEVNPDNYDPDEENLPVAWIRTDRGWHCTAPWMTNNFPWSEVHWRSGELTVLSLGPSNE